MKKVMIFGTFDGLHPGHLDFIKQARKYGDYLVVSLARDNIVPQFKKKRPMFSENERLELISSLKLVDKAVLGNDKRSEFYNHIKAEAPDVICLGYDQWAREADVCEELKKVGIFATKIVRLAPYKETTHKSSKMKSKRWHKSL